MRKYFRELTLSFVFLTIAVNAAAEALPFNNISTAEISDKYHTLFTPAGYVFAIWGVIYIGWLAFAIYPYLDKKQKYDWLLPAFPYFILSAIANMTWLVAWHYEQLGVSVIVMLVLLVSLIQVYRKLEIGIYPASLKTKWMVHIPVSIYLGWISVATIANIAAFLVQIQWDRFGLLESTWAIILILVATVLGCIMLITRRDFAFVAVLMWAFVGISNMLAGREQSENLVLILGMAIFFIISLYQLFVKNPAKQ